MCKGPEMTKPKQIKMLLWRGEAVKARGRGERDGMKMGKREPVGQGSVGYNKNLGAIESKWIVFNQRATG